MPVGYDHSCHNCSVLGTVQSVLHALAHVTLTNPVKKEFDSHFMGKKTETQRGYMLSTRNT